MRGYCKCDLCGGVYHKKDNEFYDGITVWRNNCNGTKCLPDDCERLITPYGESTDISPAVMDVCPNCFERFYNWIRMTRNNSDFPMNPPE